VTDRDLDLLEALDRCPLTARQLLKVSRTFRRPFTSERKARARLQRLRTAGRVRSWPLLVAARGGNYYTLAREGYRLLYGPAALPPARRSFGPVGVAHQQHTHALAEFIVHAAVGAHEAGVHLGGFCRENSVRLAVGPESLAPDCAFQVQAADGGTFQFFVELDNRSERIRSAKDADSWQRKIRLYEAFQDACPRRFRVLAVCTRGGERLGHILGAAASLARNPARSLFYAISLPEFLHQAAPLTSTCFLDHRGRRVALVPAPLHPLRSRQPAAVPTGGGVCYAGGPAR